jgi:hypothetical protein
MKTINPIASFAVGCGLFAASVTTVRATQAVVSNLQAPGEVSALLRNSKGLLLSSESTIRLLRFPGKSPTEIAALAQVGLDALLEQSQAFGAQASVGDGAQQAGGGRFEFRASSPLTQDEEAPHLLVSTYVHPATEFLLLRLPVTLPADALAGPEACPAVHLDNAVVVFGTKTTMGFQTALPVVPSSFETWIAAQFGQGALPGDLLADADPDHDGVQNLLEYAMGTNPSVASSREVLTARRAAGGTIFVRYIRRTNDPGVACRAEYHVNLSAEHWTELESPVQAPAEIPFAAPEGCEWVEQALPAGNRGFARLKAVVTEP